MHMAVYYIGTGTMMLYSYRYVCMDTSNWEEIAVPLSIAKCYHHSKVLLCGYRYCYRHCLYRYCTGTVPALYYMGTGTMLYRYVCMATGNTVYGYQYCLLLPTGHIYTVTGNFMRWRPGNFMASSLVINRFSEHGYILVCAP